MSTISLNLSSDDMAALRKEAVGETVTLQNVTINITANDGKTLTGTVEEIEFDAEAEDAAEGESEPKASRQSTSSSPDAGAGGADMDRMEDTGAGEPAVGDANPKKKKKGNAETAMGIGTFGGR